MWTHRVSLSVSWRHDDVFIRPPSPRTTVFTGGPKKKGRGVTHSRDKSARVSRAPGGCYHLLSGIRVTKGDPLDSLPPASRAYKTIRAVGRRRGGAVHGWRAAGWDLARGRPARRESNDRTIIRCCCAVIWMALTFGEGLARDVILAMGSKPENTASPPGRDFPGRGVQGTGVCFVWTP